MLLSVIMGECVAFGVGDELCFTFAMSGKPINDTIIAAVFFLEVEGHAHISYPRAGQSEPADIGI